MTTLALNKPYGTYQKVNYQTVDFTPVKSIAINLLKLVLVLLVVLSAVIVAVALFNLIVIASQFVVGWFAIHGWQVAVTIGVFVGAWKMKP